AKIFGLFPIQRACRANTPHASPTTSAAPPHASDHPPPAVYPAPDSHSSWSNCTSTPSQRKSFFGIFCRAFDASCATVPRPRSRSGEPAGAFGFGGGEEGGGELLVEGEQVLDALALAGEGLRAITQVHRPVQVGMGFDQGRRHGK